MSDLGFIWTVECPEDGRTWLFKTETECNIFVRNLSGKEFEICHYEIVPVHRRKVDQ